MALSSTLLKAVAFVSAPKTALIVSHPVRGLAAVVAIRAAKRAAPPRLGTALAVLAGATALPFVLRAWKGRPPRTPAAEGTPASKSRAAPVVLPVDPPALPDAAENRRRLVSRPGDIAGPPPPAGPATASVRR